MLDEKGIYLAEVSHKYPREFQTLGYDVLFDTDEMNKPKILSSFQMCVNSILTLLYMKPGQYPSIPELGIDIEQYLHEYSDDKTIAESIKSKLEDQLAVLGYVGITTEVFNDITSDGRPALIVRVSGTERMQYGDDKQNVVIGITYNQLGRIYARIKYLDYNIS
jgi:hypothetical protein